MKHPVSEILVIHHSHTDWGYTTHQSVIGEAHARFIDQAVALCEGNEDRPESLRYRWTCESAWVVHEYLRRRSPRQRQAFLQRTAQGDIEVAALPLQPTPLADARTIAAALSLLDDLRSEGIPVSAALGCDINGLSWPWADALLEAGVTALGMAMNFVCGGGMPRWTAFRWKSSRGRLLSCWQGTHYNQGAYWGLNHDAYPMETVVPERIAELESFPYSKALLQVTNIPPDNMGPHPSYLDGLAYYNRLARENGWPTMRTATLREWFDFLAPHMAAAPVLEGDWTDWWASGVGSTPRETAALLEAQRRAGLAEKRGLAPVHAALVRRKIFLASEHTWGASTSVQAPGQTSSVAGLAAKQNLVYEALYAAHDALRGTLPGGTFMHDPSLESFDPAWRTLAGSGRTDGAHPFALPRPEEPEPAWDAILGDGFGQAIHETPADGKRGTWFEVGRFNRPESHGQWPAQPVWKREILPGAEVTRTAYGTTLRLDITLRLDWTHEPRAVYIRFPFRMADPAAIAADVGGAWADPRSQLLPGSCVNWWCVHRGVLLSSPGGSVLWTPWDAPLTMFDAVCPNPPKAANRLAGPQVELVSWPLNTYWFTNFAALSGGEYHFRYRLKYWPRVVTVAEAEAYLESDPLPSYPSVISRA